MLSVVGLSHKTAPLLVRERVSFGEASVVRALPILRSLPLVREALLLSTCNRTEVYLVTPGAPSVDQVAGALANLRSTLPESFASFLTVRRGEAAARHAVRVASGLESMIVGEQQILSQVRRAFGMAREARSSGPVLNRLLQLALAAGRRVRTETALGRRPSSVPHAALALCRSQWGTSHGRAVLVVGAGEMAALAAKVFATDGARIAVIANRSPQPAEVLAARYDARLCPLDAVPSALREVDAMIISVGADRPLFDTAAFAGIGGRAEPLVVVDIGVPRGVDPDVAALPQVRLYDLDALAPDGPAGALRPEDLADAEGIVDEAVEAFMRWLASRPAVPVIAALHHRAEQIIDAELFRARARLHGLDERQRRAVRGVVEGALRKLLHEPFVRLRANGNDARLMALARELFDLDGDPVEDRDE